MTRVPGRLAATVTALASVLLAAACAADEDLTRVESPLADCDALTTPPPAATAAGGDRDSAAGSAGGDGASPPPELELACFTGGAPVALPELRGPAVVNLWATWCLPCREELPVLQRLADRAGDDLHVVGVITDDTAANAASFAADFDLRFPSLYDPDRELYHQLGTAGLPTTLFIDDTGAVRYLYLGPPFDDHDLAQLVDEHLGLTVPPPDQEAPDG